MPIDAVLDLFQKLNNNVLELAIPIDLTNLIDQYCENYKKQKKPKGCELCKSEGCLHWHSIYWRHVITFSGKRKVPIRRVKCKKCGRTFPVLPDFILKYHRYGADVILVAMEGQKEGKHDEEIASDLYEYNLAVGVLTVRSWRKKILISALKKLRRRFIE